MSSAAHMYTFLLRIYVRVHLLGQKTRTCLASVDIDKQFSKTPEPIYTQVRVRVVSHSRNTWYTVFFSLVILVCM